MGPVLLGDLARASEVLAAFAVFFCLGAGLAWILQRRKSL